MGFRATLNFRKFKVALNPMNRILNFAKSYSFVVVAICRIAALLQGKGGGKKGRYQGKASTLKTRNEAEEVLKEFTALSMNGTA